MVRHIVMFKFKDETKIEKAKELLLSMKGNVPTAKNIVVGVDFLRSARSYDLYLAVDVENKQALEEYQNDHYHCSVVKTYMHEHATSSVAIDFEL